MESSAGDNDHAVTSSWRGWGQHPQKFGLEMQYPWSKHLLNGSKLIETRGYDLPSSLISTENNEVKIDILESQQGKDGVSSVPNVVYLTSQSPLKRIGWTTFVQSIRYKSREQFEADADKHLVDPSSGYGWNDNRPMYGWVVGSCGAYIVDENTKNIIAKRRMRSLFQIVTTKPVILITGASGMLGRAIYRLLCQEDSLKVIGTGYKRLKVDDYNLHQLNLLNHDATTEYLNKCQPDIIVHCAAERYPDAFQSKLDESIKLNVESTRYLAQECKRLAGENNGKLGPYLIYISTSYVFDGGIVSNELPPYKPNSKANPINNYGQSKWDGECVVREILNKSTNPGNGIIIRVPLLYGEDCNDLSESPALEMTKCFLPSNDTTSKKAIDHWALRFPTSCEDVARVLKLMIQRILDNKFPVADSSFDNTYHVASPYGTTKYELMKMQAKLLNISSSLVEERTEGNSDGPPKDSAPRPQCTQLDCSETYRALGGQIEFTTLEDGMTRALRGFPDRFVKE